ncbi:MAG: sigma-70 family RNA polymerase sigma factor [candidate division KSB1 bacterium]|nr:sigma-70 family RNA polymerase sigma factor [candidate division KSB1 bacterium]MDZ7314475.1 sigma-70 family RNA polymerase sigma factor [candidate division KSB1 bacterium]
MRSYSDDEKYATPPSMPSGMATDEDDRTWIEATLRGDKETFAHLVAKYQRPLYTVLRRLVRNHDDTDDLLQEAFVRAYQHLKEFDRSRPFYPWLHRIAVNLAITFIQRRKRLSRLSELSTEEIFPTAPEENDPDKKTERREFLVALEKAIERLPAEQRVVLLLRTREEMSYQELSERLGIELGTVMSRLARAREKLRAWLRPYWETSKVEPNR